MLRYGTYVESSAPLFGWWSGVVTAVHELYNSVTVLEWIHCFCCQLLSTVLQAWAMLQALATAKASNTVATDLSLPLEAVKQYRIFQYNPEAYGMRSYATQVQGFVPHPWYERLLKSAHMQASYC